MAGLQKKIENIFKKQKTPKELVAATVESLIALNNKDDPKVGKSAVESLSKYLQEMKVLLYGDAELPPNPEEVTQLAHEAYKLNLLTHLVEHIDDLEFEARKVASQVFNNLLRRQSAGRYPTVEYICRNTQILDTLINGYEKPEISLICGSILRECARHEVLVREVLQSPKFYKFFTYVDQNNFEVASDAFATFKELLSKHKSLCSDFFDKNFDTFFGHYKALLESQNYVTRRQSLKVTSPSPLTHTHSDHSAKTPLVHNSIYSFLVSCYWTGPTLT
eukprot:GEZU01015759.1.p1 GENE.GEZU01015759.1~~GEZU01015759.1.p1  ORF type:complete len:277 (-),score=48.63 GEZU01015759.1:430-1260(-)